MWSHTPHFHSTLWLAIRGRRVMNLLLLAGTVMLSIAPAPLTRTAPFLRLSESGASYSPRSNPNYGSFVVVGAFAEAPALEDGGLWNHLAGEMKRIFSNGSTLVGSFLGNEQRPGGPVLPAHGKSDGGEPQRQGKRRPGTSPPKLPIRNPFHKLVGSAPYLNVDIMNDVPSDAVLAQQRRQIKKTVRADVGFTSVAAATMLGRRKTDEDAVLVYSPMRRINNAVLTGIFDGHGGQTTSQFCAENASEYIGSVENLEEETLINACLALDNDVINEQGLQDGSTGNMVIIENGSFKMPNANFAAPAPPSPPTGIDSDSVLHFLRSNAATSGLSLRNDSSSNEQGTSSTDMEDPEDYEDEMGSFTSPMPEAISTPPKDSPASDPKRRLRGPAPGVSYDESQLYDDSGATVSEAAFNSWFANSATTSETSTPRGDTYQFKITTINIGDSRAFLLRPDGSFVALSYDHKPEDAFEQNRIRRAGGFVTPGSGRSGARVNGILSLSRAFGDRDFKDRMYDMGPREQKVVAVPSVYGPTYARDGDYIIQACDGMFEAENMTWEHVANLAHKTLQETNGNLAKTAHVLIRDAWENMSYDNVSVLIIRLQSQQAAFPMVTNSEVDFKGDDITSESRTMSPYDAITLVA
eukprot:GHVT01000643.1.p1 GENE.GHVT01000643.1~~GHVT01000643.1.p1  ORF type:complete len:638 (-),score=67.34 GHVT01000643.1:716-2629(-)